MAEHVNTSGLWELKGAYWTLPIFVEFDGDTALVRIPDIPLLVRQRDALVNALTQMRIGGTETEFVVPTSFLVDNAVKSEFGDPEAVVMWRWTPPTTQNIPKEEGVDEFILDWLLNTGFGISKATASAIYISLCTHMLHWLVNRRKPVNLMFGVLDPFQYRKNWKEVILGKAAAKLMTSDAEWPHIPFINSYKPTEADFVQSEMVAYDEGVCRWSLEFTPSEWFHNHSNQLEENRRKRLGAKNYLVSVSRTIMSHAERAGSVYRKFIHEISHKVVALPEFNQDGSGYFTTLKKHSKRKALRASKYFVLPPDIDLSSLKACPEEREEREDTALL